VIEVSKIDDQTFEVAVEGKIKTTHRVTVSPQFYQKLTDGKMPIERLVEVSFKFLLQREPNTSILRSFDLPVISRYFPEYEQTIRGVIGN